MYMNSLPACVCAQCELVLVNPLELGLQVAMICHAGLLLRIYSLCTCVPFFYFP